MTLELWYDNQILLIGHVETRRGEIECELNGVILYAGGLDYDVTEFFKEKHAKTFELMAERFSERAREVYTQIA
jgi:hypothetical protein